MIQFSTTGFFSKGNEIKVSNPLFTAGSFTTAEIWKQLKCPSTGEWTKEVDGTLFRPNMDKSRKHAK